MSVSEGIPASAAVLVYEMSQTILAAVTYLALGYEAAPAEVLDDLVVLDAGSTGEANDGTHVSFRRGGTKVVWPIPVAPAREQRDIEPRGAT